MEFSIIRGLFTVDTVSGAHIIPETGGVAYCRIIQFGESTTKELDETLVKLQKQGMTALIIDLRNNPGGLVASVVPACSRFLPAGKLIISIEGRNNQKSELFSDDLLPKYENLPLIVLINGESASAAEIFAACMKDYKRAVLIGSRSYGKGSVQTMIPLEHSDALRLTTAKYYTPGRHAIHGHGIDPDIEVSVSASHAAALANQMVQHPGELNPRVRVPVRDPALERSIEILKGLSLLRGSSSNGTDNDKQ